MSVCDVPVISAVCDTVGQGAATLIGSVFTVAGGALFVAGGAARLGARRRVRISVGANRGVPTLMAQF